MNISAAIVTEPYMQNICFEVSCTRCTVKFRDADQDTVMHFDSIPAALRDLATNEWDVNAAGPRCPSCVAETTEAKPRLATRRRCLYCEPPLLWHGPLPGHCECAKDSHTCYESVPFISVTSQGFRAIRCLTLWCQECDAPFGRDGAVAHLDSLDQGRQRARKDGWRATETALICRTCRVLSICARRGHLNDSHAVSKNRDQRFLKYCSRCERDYPAGPLTPFDRRRRSA